MYLGAGTQRSETNEEYVYWGCTATILGDLAKPVRTSTCFKLRSGTQCIKLERNPRPESLGKIKWTLVKNLQENREYRKMADKCIVCASAVLTLGILLNSGVTEDSAGGFGVRNHTTGYPVQGTQWLEN